MKKPIQLFLISVVLGMFFVSNNVYAQHIPLKPPPPDGSGINNGGPKSPEEQICPLSLYYNQTASQLEFENQESSSVTFTYYVFDEDNNIVDYNTICINGNTSYLLYLNSNASETYKIQIIVDNVVYEGYFGT